MRKLSFVVLFWALLLGGFNFALGQEKNVVGGTFIGASGIVNIYFGNSANI